MNANRHYRRGARVALASCIGIVAIAAEPPPPVSGPGKTRQVSPQITGAVAAALPKYAAPVTVTETLRPIETGSASDDVLQLPNMRITTPKVPPSTEYDWLTPKGRIAIAIKKYPGLGVGNLFGLNGGIALAMLEEERQVEKRAAFIDEAERGADNTPEARRIKRLVQAAIQRPNTAWRTARGGKSGGP